MSRRSRRPCRLPLTLTTAVATAAFLVQLTPAAAQPSPGTKTIVLGGKKFAPPNPLSLLSTATPDALAGNLRGFLARELPTTLYEGTTNWGHTRSVHRVKWKGQGVDVHPNLVRVERNDGTWREVKVTASNLPDTLIVDLRGLTQPEPGRLTFTLFVSFDARGEVTQQVWRKGLRLYDGSVRARLRLRLKLDCEATAQLDPNGGFFPDAIFRLRAVKADAGYDNFVVEHVAGVGGELAKVFGDTARGGLDAWHPSLQTDLIHKTNEAIVKAADTKEVRVSLTALFKAKH